MRRRAKWQWLLVALAVLIAGAVSNVWLVTTLQYRRALRKEGFVGEMPAPGAQDRILVVAPHPDDEMIGCGGLIRRARAEGADVRVALMTNGDGSELALIFGERDLPLGPAAFIKLGLERQRESISALEQIGLGPRFVRFLGYPNNGLVELWQPAHWSSRLYRAPNTHATHSPYRDSVTPGARYCGEQVLADLSQVLRELRPTMVFVPHPNDIHPDHWATDAFARYALSTLAMKGEAWAQDTRVYGYLVHWPSYPAPRRFLPRISLLPPPSLLQMDAGWQKLPLTKEEVQQKLRAIRHYHSQLPNLDRLLLAFVRENEMFAELPPVTVTNGRVGWHDEAAKLHRMGGADVSGVQLRVSEAGAVAVEITTPRAKIPSQGYVAVDLRGWDDRARPVIATAYVEPTGGRAVAMDALGRLHSLPLSIEADRLGHISVTGLRWPGGTDRRTAFLSCWGKGHGHRLDPAVVAVLER